MRKIQFAALAALAGALIIPASATARLRAPSPVSPANNATVQELPAVSWQAVRGAAQYEYQISSNSQFSSIVGSGNTYNLAAAVTKLQPDGAYAWRVRALTKTGAVGRWSKVRRIVKRWTAAPQIFGGDGVSVSWPATPLVLRWSQVPSAYKYIVTIATDPALSNIVLGSVSQPVYTHGNSYVFPTTLASGTYYWAITPVDAEGHRGVRSRVGAFHWNWPTSTRTSVADLNPDPRVFDPFFSWNPVPGAARYEVEINSAANFPAGSKWCCNTPTIGTSLAPQKVLANNGYYWRVRAVDANGNAGQWNYGKPFTKQFDSLTPSIPNLTVRDAHGLALTGTPSTDTPIVTWSPVPGASRYEVQLAPYTSLGPNDGICDWSHVSSPPYHAETAATAWTPLGSTMTRPGPSAWPTPQSDIALPANNATYCVRVLARSDDDALQHQVVSDWTYVNSTNNSNKPAFTYAPQPTAETSQTFSPFTPAGAYVSPASGTVTPRTPLFTWNWLPGAKGYYVVIARDSQFTQVIDVGFTNVPAYAPRLANGEPLSDETTTYYWAVIPVVNSNGTLFNDSVLQDNARHFNKSSVPPTPLVPANRSSVSTWPTFRWTGAENARNYQLQVSQDPSFGKLLDNVTTDATAYTSSSTYPADTVLYWRVRANDWTGQGLNWSSVRTFTRHLPAPSPLAGNPAGGIGGSVDAWTAVPGAIAYDVHLDQGDGTSNDYTVDSTAFAATSWHGVGTIHWQVRALFPTSNFAPVGGPFFTPQPYLLTLGAPAGAHGVKTGARLVISWDPDSQAKQYEVQLSNSQSFSTFLAFQFVDATTWTPSINYSLPFNRGRLYWRVAAVDPFGTVGSFASGSFLNRPPKPKHKAKKRPKPRRHSPHRHR